MLLRHLESFSCLADAAAAIDGIVELWGDYGGPTYVIARANSIKCDEATLDQLVLDLNRIFYPDWHAENTTGVRYVRVNPWAEWAKRPNDDRLVLHSRLENLNVRLAIERVLDGVDPRISF